MYVCISAALIIKLHNILHTEAVDPIIFFNFGRQTVDHDIIIEPLNTRVNGIILHRGRQLCKSNSPLEYVCTLNKRIGFLHTLISVHGSC